MSLKKQPKSMVVVGAGAIGVEFAYFYNAIGTEVTIVEFMEQGLVPREDADISKELGKVYKKKGIKVLGNTSVESVDTKGKNCKVKIKNRKTGKEEIIECEVVLSAAGVSPNTENIGLEALGIKTERGLIQVDDFYQTNVAGIYAIGDVIKGAMLAHKAEEEGTLVAEVIAGQQPHIDYNLIPGVVYTWPEVAAVGKTEEQLKEAGVPYKVGKFPMRALGRARASMDIDGMVKMLAHKDTDEILGVHMVGPRVADMIAEAVAVMEFRGSAEDVARMSHAHPTYTEATREAALAATDNRAIHM